MLKNANILVTGGTGSFGKKFIAMTLAKYNPKRIVVYSRDEMKQWEMAKDFAGDDRVRFFLGDVRDKERLYRACQDIDIIIHAAAIKIVPTAEYNPFEAIKTNVIGAMNVIDCAIDQRVKKVIALSTDKACNPINLYGATKLCSDKLFVAGNVYAANRETIFAVVRYGNVMCSRGSVIPYFQSLAEKGVIPITDERMTRFMIRLEDGVELVWEALNDSLGGEIYVKKIPSMKITEIAKAIAPNAELKVIGIRPGEKLHEQMISVEDARNTYEFEGYFKILPQIEFLEKKHTDIIIRDSNLKWGRHCAEGFSYTSENNSHWMTKAELMKILNTQEIRLDKPTKQVNNQKLQSVSNFQKL